MKIFDAGLDVVRMQERREGLSHDLVDRIAEMQFPGGRYKHEFALAIERENDVERAFDMRSDGLFALAAKRPPPACAW